MLVSRPTSISLLFAALLLAGPASTPASSQDQGLTEIDEQAANSSFIGVATIREEIRTLPTYPFSDPNAVPTLAEDPRLWPYHTFEGYSHDPVPREWTVVVLENEFIEVTVLPEVGGKVWGAVEKGTGEEFIYRNEVMKFRNIALRGPWTSGGIEFNFGVIGHTPSTATPVNYHLIANRDGSVSCFVGGTDWPSRTRWTVEIRLPVDAAYFETNVTFSNPTLHEQPYYNWMTAAAFAQDDLVMTIPGDRYLTHGGEVRPWPVDADGRNLAHYAENDVGGSKSYHVVGELDDFFGGYYTDAGYGFGHWARYEDMPGQKLWIWALSGQGGIWEELLTDTDGQYVEFQAGRMLNQYSPGSTVNPITKAGFPPGATDVWSERWFPVVRTGGLTDASSTGAMHVVLEGDSLRIGVNAFERTDAVLEVFAADSLIHYKSFSALPLEEWNTSAPAGDRVQVAALDLAWADGDSATRLSRSFELDSAVRESQTEIERLVFEGRELIKARRYPEARELFADAVALSPWNRDALVELAALDLRSARYGQGLELIERARRLDAYDALANFVAGSLYEAVGRDVDARDAYAWATRSMSFRSAANTRLAAIAVRSGRHQDALEFADRALDYDAMNSDAVWIRALVARITGGFPHADRPRLERIDPLDPKLHAEDVLRTGDWSTFRRAVLRSEFPDQQVLELAVRYHSIGRTEDAVRLLEWRLGDTDLSAPTESDTGIPGWRANPNVRDPLVALWLGYLTEDPLLIERAVELAAGASDRPGGPFARPFRPESLPVIEWAAANHDAWQWTYLRGLNLWALARPHETLGLWTALGDAPDHAAFYVARAHLKQEMAAERERRGGLDAPPNPPADSILATPRDSVARVTSPESDLFRAINQADADRLTHITLIRHLLDSAQYERALERADAAARHWQDDFDLQLLQARALLFLGRVPRAVSIMDEVHVLPSENSGVAHALYEAAHILRAVQVFDPDNLDAVARHVAASREWPARLGQGRPYDHDERVQDYLDWRIARARYRAPVGNPPVPPAEPPVSLEELATEAETATGLRRLVLEAVLDL